MKKGGYWFDERGADLAVRFFERLLRHTKGEWAGEAFGLQAWQRKILRDVFGWKRADGTRKFRRVYIEIPRKNGKALAVDTPIATVDGWKKHGDLRPGDHVFGPDGQPRAVLAVTDWYDGPSWELTFSDATSIIAHDQHEWATERTVYTKRPHGSRQPLPLVTTGEIAGSLRSAARQDLVHRIAVAKALAYPPKPSPIDPYVLGVWLGDGHSACARVTCADVEIMDEVSRRGYLAEKSRPKYLYLVGRGRLQVELRDLGVLGNKHIPELYLGGSIEQRMDLLRGLMDTDGYVSAAGQCELVLTNRRLFEDAVELIRSLGFKTTVKVDRAMLNGMDCGERYRAQFWSYSDWPTALLARKASRLKERPGRRTRNGTLMIVSARPVGEVAVNCIEVEGGFYLAGRGLVKTHNSTLSAGMALLLTFADNEPGAEVYSAAADREQAAIVFDQAKQMVTNSPALARYAQVYKRAIVVEESMSSYKVLSSDAPTKHGLNAHGVIFDELHAQPNRELWDVLTTGMGSRRQPLLVAITTAGFDRNSICWEQHEYARQVLNGVIEDESFYGFIAAADEGDDWMSPAVWAKANPSLGVTVQEEYLAAEAARARQVPAYQNTFRRLHLNQWTQQEERWLDLGAWDACNGRVDEAELAGRLAYGGLDLASTTDIAAFVLVFPPAAGEETYRVVPRFWIPRENMVERARRDRVPYDAWVRDGLMSATPGNVIDFTRIVADVRELGKRFKIAEVAFDRWGAVQVSQELGGAGLTMVQFGQGFASMASPTKELLRLALDRKLAHGGQPVLRWMADNLTVEMDAAGNVKPSKKKSREKIDGMVALVMALDRALRNEVKPSVYESRGLVVI